MLCSTLANDIASSLKKGSALFFGSPSSIYHMRPVQSTKNTHLIKKDLLRLGERIRCIITKLANHRIDFLCSIWILILPSHYQPAKQIYLVFFGATAGQRIREKFANMQATYTAWLIQGNFCCSTKSPTYFQSFIRWLNLKLWKKAINIFLMLNL